MPESRQTSPGPIRIRGARQHNLRNIDVDIPRHHLVVITGPSGSGKSSLAFNTLYAEGQRRYVESLSAYARQFLDQLEQPDVDSIDGLSPAIAIEQRASTPNPRSTIATVTEIYDYLRILFAAIGVPHDPETGEIVLKLTLAEIVDQLLALPQLTRIIILAPVMKDEAGNVKPALDRLKRNGFVRARVDGALIELDEPPPRFNAKAKHSIEAVVDRLVIKDGMESRLATSVETALRWGDDQIEVMFQKSDSEEWEHEIFTTDFANPRTGFRIPQLSPRHFSFNSHLGACSACHGIGSILQADPLLFVNDTAKTLGQGAVKTWWSRNKKLRALHDRQIDALVSHFDITHEIPYADLPKEFIHALFHGSGDTVIKADWRTPSPSAGMAKPYEGLLAQAERLHATSKSETTRRNVRRYMTPQPCQNCGGRRLKPEILSVTVAHSGNNELAIDEVTAQSISATLVWLNELELTRKQHEIVDGIICELRKRLEFLENVGLSYLSLDRESGTLSGGESQRIRLATQIGAGLAGVIYVLDEPSIGLHQSDNVQLIGTLKKLRDLGNTVIVVEHDAETISAADHVIDIGPAAGPHGGQLVAQGTPDCLKNNPSSITGKYLSRELKIAVPKRRVKPPPHSKVNAPTDGWISVIGAKEHNLKDLDAAFPVGTFTCVTGVSGSGKSTLVDGILRRALFRRFYASKEIPGIHDGIYGLDQVDKAIVIDQSPIGRSPRSNPVTYAGAFTPIRSLFAQLPASKVRGYGAGRFSFNVKGGRCEHCQGDGSIKIDMHFLSDVYVTCEACNGSRYNRDTLDITYKGKNIAEILDMTVDKAVRFFARIPQIQTKLRALAEVGLGYLRLGQPANTLSGGEAQRVKLATELSKKATGSTLYILDEPTTGLHFVDIETLLSVFYRLRNAGNTLIVIEHNLDVIKCSDWIIDLGPGGGPDGGHIVEQGPPEKIMANKQSLTGKYLAKYLQP
ncbi:MAG: excinuclease ABC subunit UvrA [Verrucomicrobiales bacterium]